MVESSKTPAADIEMQHDEIVSVTRHQLHRVCVVFKLTPHLLFRQRVSLRPLITASKNLSQILSLLGNPRTRCPRQFQKANAHRRRPRKRKTSKHREMPTLKVSKRLITNKIPLDAKFDSAIDFYTEALFRKVSAKTKSVYYCNRSLANLKMENHSFALFDACEGIKKDADNSKAYYRRG